MVVHDRRGQIGIYPQARNGCLISIILATIFTVTSLFKALLFSASAITSTTRSRTITRINGTACTDMRRTFNQAALGGAAITLLTSIARDIAVVPPGNMQGMAFSLGKRILRSTRSNKTTKFTTVAIPTGVRLAVINPKAITNKDHPTISYHNALHIRDNAFASSTALVHFTRAGRASTRNDFSNKAFATPALFGLLSSTGGLNCIAIHNNRCQNVVPTKLGALTLLDNSFSSLSGLTPCLTSSLKLVPNNADNSNANSKVFCINSLTVSDGRASIRLSPTDNLRRLDTSSLLALAKARLGNVTSCHLIISDSRLRTLGSRVSHTVRTIRGEGTFRTINRGVTVATIHGNTSSIVSTGSDKKTNTRLHASSRSNVDARIAMAVGTITRPRKPNGPNSPRGPRGPRVPHSKSTIRTLIVVSLLLIVTSTVYMCTATHLQSSHLRG